MAVELRGIEPKKGPVPVELPGISDVPGRAKEIHELIARRAYGIYEGRGHVDGHAVEDWLQAESEVLATVCVGFMELNGDLSVDIGITASELPHLQVAIEPFRLIVSGKRNIQDGQAIPAEQCQRLRPVEIFQEVNLPVQVEPARARATFSNGLLEVRIPKAVKKVRFIAAKAA